MVQGTGNFLATAALVLLVGGCEEPGPAGVQVATPSIELAPFYFSLSTGAAVTGVHDLAFKLEDGIYTVVLNSAAHVSATVRASSDFATATVDSTAAIQYDVGTDYVIGNGWMDLSTHDPTDNSISTNGTLYFVRSTDYDIVKFMVLSASPAVFQIMYATMISDTISAAASERTVAYSEFAPAHFNFSQNGSITPDEWHIGLITAPVPGSPLPMPTVILNSAIGTRVGIVTNRPFGDITAAPADLAWLEDTDTNRPLSFGGSREVIAYQASDQKVVVVNPGWVYIVDPGPEGANLYKLRFVSYDQSTGIVEFEYVAL